MNANQAGTAAAASTIAELLRSQAHATPEAQAILALDHTPLNYAGLAALVTATVAKLRAEGIERGDRIGLVLPNGPCAATAFLTIAAGATAAPLNPNYRAEEFDFYLSDLNAKALIVEAGRESPAIEVARGRGIAILELHPDAGSPAGVFRLGDGAAADAAPDFAGPGDVALVLHTSGTTSRPKIVPLSHANVCASAGHIATTLRLTPGDLCLNVMPLFHIHGLMAATMASLTAGASVACSPGFDAIRIFSWFEHFKPTWYTAVPTMHQTILARAPRNREIIEKMQLRLIRSSSSALPPQVMAELEEVFGAPAIESYGMTEASHQMASNPLPPAARKPGSVGIAAGPAIGVMDDEGNLRATGETAEIVIQGPNVTSGYENNPKANAENFTNGWFRTGDQGYLDPEGYLYVTGRLKEIINRGGEKISPREVDEILMDHPAVQQAVTFAMPHDKLGEEVAAAIVPREGMTVTDREIREFASQRLADFKVPRKVLIVSEIPKGPTGKLQRIGLAKQLGLG